MDPQEEQKLQEFLKTIDKSTFKTQGYPVKKVPKPWGWEIIFTTDELPYTGKIEHIFSGKRLSLQIHDQKRESWLLLSGKAQMVIEDSEGNLQTIDMVSGFGYTTQIGQKHRLVGVEECEILEVSTPEIGDTYRLEDDYKRPTETEEMRKDPNRGWKE